MSENTKDFWLVIGFIALATLAVALPWHVVKAMSFWVRP